MRAETYAVANLAALNLIEAISAAYYVADEQTASRHEFRAREILKKLATAMGYELSALEQQDHPDASHRTASGRLRLVSE